MTPLRVVEHTLGFLGYCKLPLNLCGLVCLYWSTVQDVTHLHPRLINHTSLQGLTVDS